MVGSDRLVTVNCAGHNEILIAGLWNFFLRKHRTDLNYLGGGRAVRAHRLIMEVFLSPEKLGQCYGSLQSSQGQADQPDCAVLLEKLIEFMYTGSITVPEKEVEPLLGLSLQLGLKMFASALQSACRSRTATAPVGEPDLEMMVDVIAETENEQNQDVEEDLEVVVEFGSSHDSDKEQERDARASEPETVASPPRRRPLPITKQCFVALDKLQLPAQDRTVLAPDAPIRHPGRKRSVKRKRKPLVGPASMTRPSHSPPIRFRQPDQVLPESDSMIQPDCSSFGGSDNGDSVPTVGNVWSCQLVVLQQQEGVTLEAPDQQFDLVVPKTEPSFEEEEGERQLCPEDEVESILPVSSVQAAGGRLFRCNVCEKAFDKFQNLNYHSRLHVVKSQNRHRCDVCQQAFPTLAEVFAHARTHTEESAEAFSIKQKETTGPTPVKRRKPYKCFVCNRSYLTRANLLDHARCHADNITLVSGLTHDCHLCGKKFKQAGLLNVHVKHHTLRPYTCLVCYKMFSDRKRLIKHSLSHAS